jgi:hypothetical protein
MKKKTINAVINKKFDEWVESISDSKVRGLVVENSIITGGCIASMLLKEPPNDFDVYFTNKETVKAVAEYYVTVFNEANGDDGYVLDGAVPNERNMNREGGAALNMTPGRIKIIFDSNGVGKEKGIADDEDIAEYLEMPPIQDDNSKPKYRPIYISCNAVTLSNQIQIVLRFYGDPDNIHQHYDYVHCTNYWTSKDRKVVLKQPALESLLSKELIYIGSKYPLASVIRTRKFIKRGWSINAGQYLKMCFQISELDLKNVAVLEDQLVGVDVAYFMTLISAIQSKVKSEKEEGRDFNISYSYIATIIDKIFN